MEIVNVNDRCFLVLKHINIEKFSSQENMDAYFKNKVYLRKPDSTEVLIVHEIFDGLMEDNIDSSKQPVIEQMPNAEPITTYEQVVPPETVVDIKI